MEKILGSVALPGRGHRGFWRSVSVWGQSHWSGQGAAEWNVPSAWAWRCASQPPEVDALLVSYICFTHQSHSHNVSPMSHFIIKYKWKMRTDVLIVFDKLVKAEQNSKPSCTVVWLQVEANLVHDGRPLAGVVMLDHVMDTCCQLDPDKFKKVVFDWLI